MIDAAPVNNPVEATGPRWLRWPLVRILVATSFVMLPFILLQIVLQKLPIDKQLMKVWPALLSAACCYPPAATSDGEFLSCLAWCVRRLFTVSRRRCPWCVSMPM